LSVAADTALGATVAYNMKNPDNASLKDGSGSDPGVRSDAGAPCTCRQCGEQAGRRQPTSSSVADRIAHAAGLPLRHAVSHPRNMHTPATIGATIGCCRSTLAAPVRPGPLDRRSRRCFRRSHPAFAVNSRHRK